MIRVLHVLDELRRSGVELQVLRAASRWREMDISTAVVATGRSVGPNAGDFIDAGVTVHHVPYRPRPSFVIDLARLVRNDYDIVQFHTERAFIYSVLACRMVGAKVIHAPCTVIGIDGPWRWRRVLHRWLARRAGVCMIATSDSVAENERSRFLNPTQLVRNYIPTDDLPPGTSPEARSAFGISRETPVLMTVGNCLEIKNHESLLVALSQLDGPWFFIHVGHELDGRDRVLADQLGIAERCSFLGSRDDVPQLLRSADVFVMPSLSEGLGNAALEAAATGLVVVLADVGGLRDLRRVANLGIWTGTDPKSIAVGLREGLALAGRATPDARREQHEAVTAVYGLQRGIEEYAAHYERLASPAYGGGS